MSKILKAAGIGLAIIVTGGAAVCVYNKVKKGTWNPFTTKKQESPAPAAAPATPAPEKPEDKKPEAPAAPAQEQPKEDKQ